MLFVTETALPVQVVTSPEEENSEKAHQRRGTKDSLAQSLSRDHVHLLKARRALQEEFTQQLLETNVEHREPDVLLSERLLAESQQNAPFFLPQIVTSNSPSTLSQSSQNYSSQRLTQAQDDNEDPPVLYDWDEKPRSPRGPSLFANELATQPNLEGSQEALSDETQPNLAAFSQPTPLSLSSSDKASEDLSECEKSLFQPKVLQQLAIASAQSAREGAALQKALLANDDLAQEWNSSSDNVSGSSAGRSRSPRSSKSGSNSAGRRRKYSGSSDHLQVPKAAKSASTLSDDDLASASEGEGNASPRSQRGTPSRSPTRTSLSRSRSPSRGRDRVTAELQEALQPQDPSELLFASPLKQILAGESRDKREALKRNRESEQLEEAFREEQQREKILAIQQQLQTELNEQKREQHQLEIQKLEQEAHSWRTTNPGYQPKWQDIDLPQHYVPPPPSSAKKLKKAKETPPKSPASPNRTKPKHKLVRSDSALLTDKILSSVAPAEPSPMAAAFFSKPPKHLAE